MSEEEPVKLIRKLEKRGRPRGEKRNKKLTHLDAEAGKEITKIKEEHAEYFDCWRCNGQEYTSRNRYEWCTSQGIKTICCGCNGNLIAMRGPKAHKAAKIDPAPLATDTASTAAAAGEEEAEQEQEEASEEEQEEEEEEEQEQEEQQEQEEAPAKKHKHKLEKEAKGKGEGEGEGEGVEDMASSKGGDEQEDDTAAAERALRRLVQALVI